MFERFTRPARTAVSDAIAEAERTGDRHIGTEHLLIGLARTSAPVASSVLRDSGVTPDALRRTMLAQDRSALAAVGIDVDEALAGHEASDARQGRRSGRRRPRTIDHRPFTDGVKAALRGSCTAARELGQRRLGPEHVLLAMLEAPPRDIALVLLGQLGVDVGDLRATVLSRLERAGRRTA